MYRRPVLMLDYEHRGPPIPAAFCPPSSFFPPFLNFGDDCYIVQGIAGLFCHEDEKRFACQPTSMSEDFLDKIPESYAGPDHNMYERAIGPTKYSQQDV